MLVAGLDIGAVNIKAARCRATADVIEIDTVSFPFEGPWEAEETLRRGFCSADLVVATETVSFSRSAHRTFQEGVHWTCDVLERTFGAGRVRLIGLGDRLVPLDEARANIWLVACRNWVATAHLAAVHLGLVHDGLLIDCGTSSLDVVPIVDGRACALDGDEDRVWTRLGTGELTITGTLLTTVQGLTVRVRLRGREFVTRSHSECLTGHARVVAGRVSTKETVPGNSDDVFSPTVARRRICELVGADETLLTDDDVHEIATSVIEHQQTLVAKCVETVRRRAAGQTGRSFSKAVLAGIGAGPLLASALGGLGLECFFLSEAIARHFGSHARFEANCETAVGAALSGLMEQGF